MAAELRSIAARAKTVYGGSDFAPIDYQVVTVSPNTLIEIAERLEDALNGSNTDNLHRE